MPFIRIIECGETIDFEPGETLLTILASAGMAPASPCGGAGACGKCAATIRAGRLSPPTEQERELFTEEELVQGRRLACTTIPQSDLDVSVSQEAREGVILADGYLPAFTLDPAVVKKTVALAPTGAGSRQDRMAAALGEERLPERLLRGLPQEVDRLTAVYDDGRLLALEAGDGSGRLYGLAVDIGTTTVVASLLDLRTGRELAARSAINPQKSWGFDVLSRLGFVMEQPEQGVRVLRQAITDCLNALAGELASDAGVRLEDVYDIAVAANATMMHLLLGVDPSSMGRAPFTPRFTAAKRLPAADIGLRAGPGAALYCLPSISAYVGADIVAGIHVSGMRAARDTVLFIDIGTNGEIVLAHDGRLSACSCAAGPALEGMNISCGMRACAGAIEEIRIAGDGVELKTIGDAPAIGLCGSGVLSAVSEFLRVGLILPRGNLVKEQDIPADDPRRAHLCGRDGKPALRLVSGEAQVFLTQKDIRQVQLAKGALLSGFHSLLEQSGLAMGDLDRVLVAGQFGAHLPAASLIGCGLLPPQLGDRISYLGNTSKSGAVMALLSKSARRDMEAVAGTVRHLDLTTLAGFDRLFAACLNFPGQGSAEPQRMRPERSGLAAKSAHAPEKAR